MRLDVQPWGADLAELVGAARDAEAAGAGVAWAPELHRSAPVTAAAIAAGTSRIGVGTGIALAFACSAMLTALSAADLDELSDGRFRLGLGTGVSRLNQDWHEVPFARPVDRLRDTVTIVRAVLGGGDPISHAGVRSISVRGWRRPYPLVRASIPVYLAAVGPRLVRLAGEIADGWLSHELCPPFALRKWIWPALAVGLDRQGRDRRSFDVVAAACCSVASSSSVARRRAANVVGFNASVRSYADMFAAAGFGSVTAAASEALRSGRPADSLGDLVPPEMVDLYAIAGTPSFCAARISDFSDLADAVKLSPPSYGLDAGEVRDAQKSLLELVGSMP